MAATVFITTMDELKTKAILITQKTVFWDPYNKKRFKLNPQAFSPAYQKHFESKNGIISFIDENNGWYVIPAINGIIETLKIAGYIRGGFYVPCSEDCSMTNRSYPLKEQKRWNEMLKAVS